MKKGNYQLYFKIIKLTQYCWKDIESLSTSFKFKYMTLINIIPVEELMDQHLIAEYRKITMVPANHARTLSSKTGLDYKKTPKSYI
jgi:hypothetical protein